MELGLPKERLLPLEPWDAVSMSSKLILMVVALLSISFILEEINFGI